MAHGTIQKIYKGRETSTGKAIVRRISLHRSPVPNVYSEVLLPRHAPDHLLALDKLVAQFDVQVLPDQLDLLTITSLRFDETLTAHRQWELARGWARSSLCGRDLAALCVQHLPALAGRKNKPHVHCLAFVRQLGATGQFGAFSELTRPGAKAILADEWATWLASNA